jgi:hypothetical protein
MRVLAGGAAAASADCETTSVGDPFQYLRLTADVDAKEHLEHVNVGLYLVVAPSVGEIRIHQMWGSRHWKGSSGGVALMHRCDEPPANVTTGLVSGTIDGPDTPLRRAEPLRPYSLVSERVRDANYPNDYHRYIRPDWKRWVEKCQADAEALVLRNDLWGPTRVRVDGTDVIGVLAEVDECFSAASFCLPEGRLDVGITHGSRTPDARITMNDIEIVRFRDLNAITWVEPADDEQPE